MTDVRTDKKFFLFACLALALGTLALYWPVSHSPFTLFDDPDFICANPHITGGLNWPDLVWAFHDTHTGNWIPVTWMTHMLDCQLFGVNAGAHHLTSVCFHIANTLLLFAFLCRATKAYWRSAIVAALFAWHPVHVESVAWAAERKDVVSTFFFLLTLTAYARFTNLTGTQKNQPWIFYLFALGFFALGLMSKPMVVTLPFVLLLLDVWPLQRISDFKLQASSFYRLLAEKIPFFCLSFALCSVTFLSQKNYGAVMHIDWHTRLANVPVSYLRYVSKTIWPADLAVFYPYIYNWPVAVVVGSALLLLLISVVALRLIRQQPWLMVGWFWFLGTMVPVIGFVQVGIQSMADRYNYIPSIGLLIVIVWSVHTLAQTRPAAKKYLALCAGVILAGCLATTARQISYWQNNVRLFLHAVETTTDNYVALNSLGCALNEIGRKDDAIKVFRESIRIEPFYWPSQRNLATTLLDNNQPDAAFKQFEVVLDQLPGDAGLRYELSLRLLQYGRIEAAKNQLVAALKIQPEYSEAHELLGSIYLQQTNLTAAIPQFSETLKLNPRYAEAHLNLGLALEQQGDFHDALVHLREAARLIPGSAEIKKSLDQILAAHPELKPQL
jgi:tetratricopeptide (TPR) repeat protein